MVLAQADKRLRRNPPGLATIGRAFVNEGQRVKRQGVLNG